jgi:hypothetical protein
MPLSLKILWLLADGKEYTQRDLIKKDATMPQVLADIRGESIPMNPGNLSKTMKNLRGIGLIKKKKILKKGESNRYYLSWPDSYAKIINKLKKLEERCSIEMDLLIWDLREDDSSDSGKNDRMNKYKTIEVDYESYRWVIFQFEMIIEKFEKQQQKNGEEAFFNEHYPIAEPWSPDLSKFKNFALLIKPLCKMPEKNHGPEDAFAELIVHQLRPELLEGHFKWLEENLLPSLCDNRRIRYNGYYYWYHLVDAPFQPSQKFVLRQME